MIIEICLVIVSCNLIFVKLMEYDLQNLAEILIVVVRDFYNSPFVLVFKILVGLYLLILLINIVLILILRDIPGQVRVGLRGEDMPLVSKSKMQKRWGAIRKRLTSGNTSQYKVAVIEADAIVEEILSGIGYKGANMTEMLVQVEPGRLDDHLESLQAVHLIRNRIVHELDFEIDESVAESVIGVYEKFLKYLEFLD